MAESVTDRFGFHKQSAGTDGWPGRAGFMAILDLIENNAAMFGQGTLAARPAAAAEKRGRVYVVTGDPTPWQNGAVYYDTGGTWEQIAGSRFYQLTDGLQWDKPAGATTFTVRVIGGGGGGGSGAKGFPAGAAGKAGGGGGWPGEVVELEVLAADMPASLAVDIGEGGNAGPLQSVADSVGFPGNPGSSTLLQPVGAAYNAWMVQAAGGRGGHAGGLTPGYTIGADLDYMFSRISPRGGRGLVGNGEPDVGMGAAGGGGGGAYNNGSNNPGAPGGNGATALTGGGWGAGSANGQHSLAFHQGGGGKGGGIAAGVAQNGGVGGNYGAGGGGGAGGSAGNSGAGGNGAPGLAIIIATF